MRFTVVTIFPEMIWQYGKESILGRAEEQGLIEIRAIDLRDFTTDPHRTVDDTPYGGGPGMVLKPEPIWKALASLGALSKKTILLSPRGRQFDQRVAEEWSRLKEITFVCGRYEGVDQRVSDYMVDEEISIGPYVLAGGELGALVIIEAVARLLSGVLGNQESLVEETHGRFQISDFSKRISVIGLQSSAIDRQQKSEVRSLKSEVQIEYPHYTKPANFRGWKVPEVLLSGDHKKIAEWRKNEASTPRG